MSKKMFKRAFTIQKPTSIWRLRLSLIFSVVRFTGSHWSRRSTAWYGTSCRPSRPSKTWKKVASYKKWPTATSYHPSLRLGMKGVKEDQQIDGIAGFSVKGDIYFFMFYLDNKCGGLRFFPKDGVLSFHTFTFTVHHGLLHYFKIRNSWNTSQDLPTLPFLVDFNCNLRGRRACT